MNFTRIIGTGTGLPNKVVTNEELSKIVETSDEWITTRTGIKERRISDANTATSDLCITAGKKALAAAKIDGDKIDLIVVATCTGDHSFPSTACLVQKAIGATKSAAFDVSAACSGFIYGAATAQSFLQTQMFKRALVIGADSLSKFTDWTDRSTCVLFGDGAGAMIIERTDNKDAKGPRFLAFELGADGTQTEILNIPGGGSRHPYDEDKFKTHKPYIHMDGKEVYRHAVTRMGEAAVNALKKAGKSPEDLTLLIPHQANIRIIETLAKRLKMPMEKVFLNIHKYGNMSAATTIIALDEAAKEGRLKPGDLVELIAFGAGLTWGAMLIQW